MPFIDLSKLIVQQPGIRVLVADDYAAWSQFLCSAVQSRPEFRVVSVASNGLEAADKAQELQPDLILLDIGLPQFNGIEVALKIAQLAPLAKVLFVSENQDSEIIEEALRTGARGYVVKSQAAKELFSAIEVVMANGTFVSDQLT